MLSPFFVNLLSLNIQSPNVCVKMESFVMHAGAKHGAGATADHCGHDECPLQFRK